MTAGRRPGLMTIAAAVAEMPVRTLRPRRPDRDFLASITDAGLPDARRTVRVRRLRQVARQVPAIGVIEGAIKHAPVAIAVNAFVVEHQDATFVVDPGLCSDAAERVLPEIPGVLRRLVSMPPDAVPTARALDGIEPAFALATHAHWDHVSGLLDLGDIPLMIHNRERDWVMSGPVAPVGGVRDALNRELRGFDLSGPPVSTFTASHDVFGDGSVVLVDLAGHTPGSVGVMLRTETGPVLLAGDAAWHYDQVELIRQKPGFPGRLVDTDREQTFRTLHRLHLARQHIRIVPIHDADAATHFC